VPQAARPPVIKPPSPLWHIPFHWFSPPFPLEVVSSVTLSPPCPVPRRFSGNRHFFSRVGEATPNFPLRNLITGRASRQFDSLRLSLDFRSLPSVCRRCTHPRIPFTYVCLGPQARFYFSFCSGAPFFFSPSQRKARIFQRVADYFSGSFPKAIGTLNGVVCPPGGLLLTWPRSKTLICFPARVLLASESDGPPRSVTRSFSPGSGPPLVLVCRAELKGASNFQAPQRMSPPFRSDSVERITNAGVLSDFFCLTTLLVTSRLSSFFLRSHDVFPGLVSFFTPFLLRRRFFFSLALLTVANLWGFPPTDAAEKSLSVFFFPVTRIPSSVKLG